ncbi:MAG: peptide chain release factor N(5)-glutamine methyltransferase [Alphaproteobacteria bacterium]|nr:peptide chain release factor N(5)-glutamine methyltransferase [Alphaproteobacteria bacterium]
MFKSEKNGLIMQTIQKLFEERQNQGVLNADLKHLIAGFFDFSPSEWLLKKENEASKEGVILFQKVFQKVQNGMPVYRALGWREFYGRRFCLNDATLEPRPDSEILIEEVQKSFLPQQSFSILDLGTGTGCLLLTLLAEFPYAHGVGVDVSKEALVCASKNSETLGLIDRVKFIDEDMRQFQTLEKFDLVISNPPYIASDNLKTLDKEVQEFDPKLALDGGEDGLEYYRVIAQSISKWLKKEGHLILEIGYDQGQTIPPLFAFLSSPKITQDYGKKDRVFSATFSERI